jgi:hypothetical protein
MLSDFFLLPTNLSATRMPFDDKTTDSQFDTRVSADPAPSLGDQTIPGSEPSCLGTANLLIGYLPRPTDPSIRRSPTSPLRIDCTEDSFKSLTGDPKCVAATQAIFNIDLAVRRTTHNGSHYSQADLNKYLMEEVQEGVDKHNDTESGSVFPLTCGLTHQPGWKLQSVQSVCQVGREHTLADYRAVRAAGESSTIKPT